MLMLIKQILNLDFLKNNQDETLKLSPNQSHQTKTNYDQSKIKLAPMNSFLSQNGKARILENQSLKNSVLSTYEFYHEDGRGLVMAVVKNISQTKKELELKIVEEFEKGNFAQAESYIRQVNNLNEKNYSHRLEVYRILAHQKKILSWMIDFKIDQVSTLYYANMNANDLIKKILITLINKPPKSLVYEDALDQIFMQKDLLNYLNYGIQQYLSNHKSQDYLNSYKVIYSLYQKTKHKKTKT